MKMRAVISLIHLLAFLSLSLTANDVKFESKRDGTMGERGDKYIRPYVPNVGKSTRNQLLAGSSRVSTNSNNTYGWKLTRNFGAVHSAVDIRNTTGSKYLSYMNWTTIEDVDHSQIVSATDDVPDAIDYRLKNLVSPVEHQGRCGACWAFAVTGAVEALMAKTMGFLMKLSIQQLIDCNGYGHGCHGGSVSDALLYLEYNGLQTAFEYPYVAKKQTCKYDPNQVKFHFSGFYCFPYLDELTLKAYVYSVGPLIAHLVVNRTFLNYKSGIYSSNACQQDSRSTNHGILIVGYGSENGKDFWILKNSHGRQWGRSGYIYFQRNIALCGIGYNIVYPFIN